MGCCGRRSKYRPYEPNRTQHSAAEWGLFLMLLATIGVMGLQVYLDTLDAMDTMQYEVEEARETLKSGKCEGKVPHAFHQQCHHYHTVLDQNRWSVAFAKACTKRGKDMLSVPSDYMNTLVWILVLLVLLGTVVVCILNRCKPSAGLPVMASRWPGGHGHVVYGEDARPPSMSAPAPMSMNMHRPEGHNPHIHKKLS